MSSIASAIISWSIRGLCFRHVRLCVRTCMPAEDFSGRFAVEFTSLNVYDLFIHFFRLHYFAASIISLGDMQLRTSMAPVFANFDFMPFLFS